MTKQDKHFYEFGPFRLEPDERLLLRNQETIDLTPKAFNTLVLLVENSGHLLRKEELMRRVWPDSVVEESNLTLAIHTLRKKLNKGHDGTDYIETVPRHGYRFVCEVKLALRKDEDVAMNGGGLGAAERGNGLQAEKASQDEDGLTATPEVASKPAENAVPKANPASKTGPKRVWLWGSVVAVVLVASALFSVQRSRVHSPGKSSASIAVLPFLDLSAPPAEPYLADAVSEELTTGLAQVKGLRVTARTSAFQFRSAKDVRQIGKALSVGAVLEGSVRRTGNQLHVTAQLVNTRDGYHVWSGTFDTTTHDLLSAEQRITQEVARGLNLPFSEDQEKQIARRPTVNQEAYELCLQGRYFFSKRDPASMRRSVELFSQAVARDPGFARAHAGLAETYAVMAANGQIEYAAGIPAAESAANRALALDPSLASPHAALGLIKSQLEWNFPAAEEEFRRALDLDDNNADAHHWRGLNLTSMGHFADAEVELRKAQLLDPLTLMITEGLYENYFYARRYDDAIHEARKLLEMDPGMALGYHQLANAYLGKRMYREALAELEEGQKRDTDQSGILSTHAIISAYSGDRATAQKMLNELLAAHSRGYVEPYYLAVAYASAGDKDDAFLWLEKELASHDPGLAHLAIDPYLDSLRDDSRCLDLMRRAGLAPVPAISRLGQRSVKSIYSAYIYEGE
jgi:TolB-like protein/DNA-binding winged helix-turn-helix (wHTH) protein/Tfp pilus assembly protein PilF